MRKINFLHVHVLHSQRNIEISYFITNHLLCIYTAYVAASKICILENLKLPKKTSSALQKVFPILPLEGWGEKGKGYWKNVLYTVRVSDAKKD